MLRSEALLEDTKCALDMLEIETDPQRQRVLWFSCIGMLRAIGHVLSKVDAPQNKLLSNKQSQWWSSLSEEKDKHPHIYWDFIDPERNNTLKEYSVRFEETQIPIVITNAETGQSFIYDVDDLLLLSDNEYYQEKDARDLVLEAINWWEIQLAEIKTAIS